MRYTRILYIEDEPDQLELVQMFLERELTDVMVDVRCTVAGAEEALNLHCYDLIISDVDLPGELGTAIAARILERDPEQPIYLMSEYVADSVHREAARLGLILHRKFSSLDPYEFLSRVKVLLTKRPCPEMTIIGGDDDASSSNEGESGTGVPPVNRDSTIEASPTSPTTDSAMTAIVAHGSSGDVAGCIVDSAEARASVDPAMPTGAHRQLQRGDIHRRPTSSIRLVSPHVQAARAAFGSA